MGGKGRRNAFQSYPEFLVFKFFRPGYMFKVMATKDNLGYTAPALTAMPQSPQKEPGKVCELKFNILLQNMQLEKLQSISTRN